jgi:5-histidylcysteine sulfoxide synthase
VSAFDSTPPIRTGNIDRGELGAYFENSWQLYERLFESITGDGALRCNPDPLRHPLLFYLGHTASFYLNKLKMAGCVERSIHAGFEELFAVGVDPASPDELAADIDWPAEAEVRRFREAVHENVCRVIETIPLPEEPSWDDPVWSLLMGIEHDRIHFETSSVLIRQYPPADLDRPTGWEYAPTTGSAPDNDFLAVKPGAVRLGRDESNELYGWDCEYGALDVGVPAFLARRHLTTNEEFRQFVENGGYCRPELWSEAGREWLRVSGAAHPRFWTPADGSYEYRAMFDVMPLPVDWPVEVNAHEAQAFCNWLGGGSRLLREAEYRRIAAEVELAGGEPAFSDGFNLDLRYGSPSPVGLVDRGRTPSGFTDVYGNVWHWLEDDFRPLPGFRVHPHYADYSAIFFDEHHAVMLGGSWASTGATQSRSHRSWFRRGFFQHAGFRVARDA